MGCCVLGNGRRLQLLELWQLWKPASPPKHGSAFFRTSNPVPLHMEALLPLHPEGLDDRLAPVGMQSGVLHRGIFTHVTPQCVHLGPFDNKHTCSSSIIIWTTSYAKYMVEVTNEKSLQMKVINLGDTTLLQSSSSYPERAALGPTATGRNLKTEFLERLHLGDKSERNPARLLLTVQSSVNSRTLSSSEALPLRCSKAAAVAAEDFTVIPLPAGLLPRHSAQQESESPTPDWLTLLLKPVHHFDEFIDSFALDLRVRNCVAETRALVTLGIMMKRRSVELPELHRSSPSIYVKTSGVLRFLQLLEFLSENWLWLCQQDFNGISCDPALSRQQLKRLQVTMANGKLKEETETKMDGHINLKDLSVRQMGVQFDKQQSVTQTNLPSWKWTKTRLTCPAADR
ncbi:hypothetical protein U0070_022028, partial [Myodes glareolus]